MMNSEIYFNIEGRNLFLDFMLEEYDFIPIFYICKDEDDSRYAVLCSDIDDEEYVIVKITAVQLNEMLHGTMDIRDLFLKQHEFWKIQCPGEDFNDDLVTKYDISEFPEEILPASGVRYKIFDESHRHYAQKIQNELQKERLIASMQIVIPYDIKSFVQEIEKILKLQYDVPERTSKLTPVISQNNMKAPYEVDDNKGSDLLMDASSENNLCEYAA